VIKLVQVREYQQITDQAGSISMFLTRTVSEPCLQFIIIAVWWTLCYQLK
jgi:hypothetical protein